MDPSSRHSDVSKFTRGEKCLFVHVVISFVAIVAIVIVYYGHACLVRHRGQRILAVERRLATNTDDDAHGGDYRCVGAAYVSQEGGVSRVACGTIAVHARWSVAPGRCVAARADPHLSYILPHWTLRYDHHRTGIRRGVTHPHFEPDVSPAADIGIFEHELQAPPTALCPVPILTRRGTPTSVSSELFVVGWRDQDDKSTIKDAGRAAAASVMQHQECTRVVAPVAALPASSLCLMLRAGAEHLVPRPALGSMVFDGAQLVGVISWNAGTEQTDSLPMVAVRVAPFQHWLETSMKILLE